MKEHMVEAEGVINSLHQLDTKDLELEVAQLKKLEFSRVKKAEKERKELRELGLKLKNSIEEISRANENEKKGLLSKYIVIIYIYS